MIRIVTDSTSYLSAEELEKYKIPVVRLNGHFRGQQTFQEGVTLNNDQFYTMLANSPELPTTSQPSPGQFLEVFTRLAQEGHDILCLVISSKLSGTYQSALDAKKALPEANIEVFDSYLTAAPLGLMVLTAAEMAASGHTMDEILARLEQMSAQGRPADPASAEVLAELRARDPERLTPLEALQLIDTWTRRLRGGPGVKGPG